VPRHKEPRIEHLTRKQLQGGLAEIRAAPKDEGRLEMIVIRPATDERVVLEACQLTRERGCEGDDWRQGHLDAGRTPDPQTQLTLMNARCAQLISGGRDRWPLAGDQLFVELDLGEANLPVGQRLAIGDAIVEITAEPHTGCAKFAARFGVDALKFVNMGEGARLKLRGIYAMVITEGAVHQGDAIRKVGGTMV
jgi:hypothetical protein